MATAIPTTRNSSASKNTYNALPDGDYPARIVRFVGLGVQEQPEYQGQKKDPAFKCSLQVELIGVDATGVDGEGKALEARPACQFKDYFLFPGAKRGGVYDLVRVLDPSLEKVPGDLEWFIDKLDSIVNVTVGHYMTKQGEKRNKIVAISSIPSMFKSQVGAARSDMVGFNPYIDSPEMMAAYGKIFKFQRDILAEAFDRDNIPYAGKEAPKQEGGYSNTPSPAAPGTTPKSEPVTYDNDAPF
ncbi:MAG: hypothetical protein ACRC6V_12220 [Bacteroidales bacterium]